MNIPSNFVGKTKLYFIPDMSLCNGPFKGGPILREVPFWVDRLFPYFTVQGP